MHRKKLTASYGTNSSDAFETVQQAPSYVRKQGSHVSGADFSRLLATFGLWDFEAERRTLEGLAQSPRNAPFSVKDFDSERPQPYLHINIFRTGILLPLEPLGTVESVKLNALPYASSGYENLHPLTGMLRSMKRDSTAGASSRLCSRQTLQPACQTFCCPQTYC